MNHQLLDSKLKKLITLCKETQNYKKLALVGYMLISARLNEIGMNLAIRPRNIKGVEESLSKYMELINSMLKGNLNLILFKESFIRALNKIETMLFTYPENIPYQNIIALYEIYYYLRELDIPNLYRELGSNQIDMNATDPNFHSFYRIASSLSIKSKKKEDMVRTLMLHKIKEREDQLQKLRNNAADGKEIEYAIYLKGLKDQISSSNLQSGKIEVKGQLKDNLIYQFSKEKLIGYWILGGFVLFLLLGLIVTREMMMYPALTVTMSGLTFIFFSTSIVFFLYYWNYWKKSEKEA